MATSTSTSKSTKTPKTNPTPQSLTPATLIIGPRPHRVRTALAALCGIIALCLVLFSILVVWLNRTLTNTDTYVATVAPLVDDPAIQSFVAKTAVDTVLKNDLPPEAIAMLVPAADAAGKTPEQLKQAAGDALGKNVLQIMDSEQFQATWRNTNANAHRQLVSQLQSDSGQLSLDLSPVVRDIVAQLKTTQLAPVADQIVLPVDAGKVNLKGGSIEQAHTYYKQFQTGTVVLVVLTIVAIALCVLLSVQHWRTLRRILIGTGIISLVLAVVLQAPSIIKLSGADVVIQRAALAFAGVLFHDLQVFLVIFGLSCFAAAIVSKVYSTMRRHAAKK